MPIVLSLQHTTTPKQRRLYTLVPTLWKAELPSRKLTHIGPTTIPPGVVGALSVFHAPCHYMASPLHHPQQEACPRFGKHCLHENFSVALGEAPHLWVSTAYIGSAQDMTGRHTRIGSSQKRQFGKGPRGIPACWLCLFSLSFYQEGRGSLPCRGAVTTQGICSVKGQSHHRFSSLVGR